MESKSHNNVGISQYDVIISGGGPAGMVLGYLFAQTERVRVIVLEKHQDFNRDFRGDTIHPSTMQMLEDLGLIDDFFKLNVDRIVEASGNICGRKMNLANFSYSTYKYKFIGLVPQHEFLEFLAEKAKKFPNFSIKMNCNVKDLLRNENGKVEGVLYVDGDAGGDVGGVQSESKIVGQLVVVCDGRHSNIPKLLNLSKEEIEQPMDVLWFKLDRDKKREDAAEVLKVAVSDLKTPEMDDTDEKTLVESVASESVASESVAAKLIGEITVETESKTESAFNINAFVGGMCVVFPRRNFYQVGWLISKGSVDLVKKKTISEFQDTVAEKVPELKPYVHQLLSWEQCPMLVVRVDRLTKWFADNILCIGDAAHAMSPVGGVGINVAINDAVRTFNELYKPIVTNCLLPKDLQRVQDARLPAVKRTQFLQTKMGALFKMAMEASQAFDPPMFWRLTNRFEWLRGMQVSVLMWATQPERPIPDYVRGPLVAAENSGPLVAAENSGALVATATSGTVSADSAIDVVEASIGTGIGTKI